MHCENKGSVHWSFGCVVWFVVLFCGEDVGRSHGGLLRFHTVALGCEIRTREWLKDRNMCHNLPTWKVQQSTLLSSTSTEQEEMKMVTVSDAGLLEVSF